MHNEEIDLTADLDTIEDGINNDSKLTKKKQTRNYILSKEWLTSEYISMVNKIRIDSEFFSQ